MSRFGKLKTTDDVLFYRLGAALTMELTVIELVDRLQPTTDTAEFSDLLGDCADLARRHVTNLEASFRLAGKEPWERPCPAMSGLIRDADLALRRARRELRDSMIATSAREILGYGVSTYETLLDLAEAMREPDVTVLLRENLDEQHEAVRAVNDLARVLAVRGSLVAAH